MKLKVLVTGKNRKVAKDIAQHLIDDRGYNTIFADAQKTILFDVTLAELPRVIIICLGNETRWTVEVFDVLCEPIRHGRCSVIVVANDEDERLFTKYTELRSVSFLSRPVSLFALYERLEQIEEEMKKTLSEPIPAFREFENPRNGVQRKRILVVDDDTEQLVLVKEQLEEFYEVTCVKSGAMAFVYLEKHRPDLVLLDYLMPGLSGPDVLREMQRQPMLSDIPVIFLTGMTEKSAVLTTLAELRPQGYIIKPAKRSELVAKIIDVLDSVGSAGEK